MKQKHILHFVRWILCLYYEVSASNVISQYFPQSLIKAYILTSSVRKSYNKFIRFLRSIYLNKFEGKRLLHFIYTFHLYVFHSTNGLILDRKVSDNKIGIISIYDSRYKSLIYVVDYLARRARVSTPSLLAAREYPLADPDLASSFRVVFQLEIPPRVEEILPTRVRGMRIPRDSACYTRWSGKYCACRKITFLSLDYAELYRTLLKYLDKFLDQIFRVKVKDNIDIPIISNV